MQLPLPIFAEVLDALKEQSRAGAAAEKRRATRHTLQAQVTLLAGPPALGKQRVHTVLTRDISHNGVGLLQTATAAPNDKIILLLPRRKREPVCVQCTVMHCRPLADGVFAVGAEFVQLVETQPKDPQPRWAKHLDLPPSSSASRL